MALVEARDCTTATCVHVPTGKAGEYTLLWGIQEPHGIEEDVSTESGTDETSGYYEVTPLAAIYQMLQKIQRQDASDPAPPEDGWWRGGVMERMAKSPSPHLDALEIHAMRTTTGHSVMYLWDMVTPEAPGLETLKYVLDAARPPLQDCPEFEKKYGISRYLTFSRQEHRVPPENINAFEGVY